jgi:hypothetical protein
MKNCVTFIGLDVHKDSIETAVAEGFGKQEVRHYGTVGGDLDSPALRSS